MVEFKEPIWRIGLFESNAIMVCPKEPSVFFWIRNFVKEMSVVEEFPCVLCRLGVRDIKEEEFWGRE